MDTCSNEIAKVTTEGGLFNGEYYSSLWALKENWFETVSVYLVNGPYRHILRELAKLY
jgi:hypothetical protein